MNIFILFFITPLTILAATSAQNNNVRTLASLSKKERIFIISISKYIEKFDMFISDSIDMLNKSKQPDIKLTPQEQTSIKNLPENLCKDFLNVKYILPSAGKATLSYDILVNFDFSKDKQSFKPKEDAQASILEKRPSMVEKALSIHVNQIDDTNPVLTFDQETLASLTYEVIFQHLNELKQAYEKYNGENIYKSCESKHASKTVTKLDSKHEEIASQGSDIPTEKQSPTSAQAESQQSPTVFHEPKTFTEIKSEGSDIKMEKEAF